MVSSEKLGVVTMPSQGLACQGGERGLSWGGDTTSVNMCINEFDHGAREKETGMFYMRARH
jgi:hypothetical protein